MFHVGDYIICGNNGVCQVTAIGKLDLGGMKNDKIFYTLSSVFTNGKIVYTPVDNTKVIMRPILTKEEAKQLIDEIEDIEEIWIQDEKSREHIYKKAVQTCDCRELIKIIKTLYIRKKERTDEGKKITAVDEKYFHYAEDHLYEELSIPLGIDKEKMAEFIANRVAD